MGLIPDDVLFGDFPDIREHPLFRLRATCLKHWGKVTVGEPFRWDNENIRLTPEQDTSFDQWEKWRKRNRLAPGFPWHVRLFCPVCGVVTKHVPEGKTDRA